ncbi:hypothetical protein PT285_07415 [Lactobacillus sp. ESL0791]|uniref:hypothetical protein n=1 Tax=Lactobacillus sp. ESL0791 TaxID=2983234 RepID=UPI0023F71148|nr:hypothetical protein [Lactobacillus sp. ESL0791]MDF7639227.1 hypothetical protein [Lactobacillus sp. ESL0791]
MGKRIRAVVNALTRTTTVIKLKDGKEINLKNYPELQTLGNWSPSTVHNTRLHLFSSLSIPEIIKLFSKITGLTSDQFEVQRTMNIFNPVVY